MIFTLQTKIWVAVSSIVLGFSIFMLFFFPYQNTRNFESYYKEAANKQALMVANSLEASLEEQNFMALEIIMGFIRKDSRLEFITIAQPDTIYQDESNPGFGQFSIEWNVFKSYPDSFVFSSETVKSDQYITGSSKFHTDIMEGLVLIGFNKLDIIKHKDRMMTVSVIISSVIFLVGLYFSYLLSRSIARRVEQLRDAAIQVGGGNLSQKIPITVKDEIGELAEAFNFMIEDLDEANQNIREKTQKLQSSYKIIEEYNKNITDSIRYAKRIQTAMLPQLAEVESHFPDSFILSLPKDIVSGDFYWVKEASGQTLFCLADCTGHGVPGAFTSLVCSALLQLATEKSSAIETDMVFSEVRSGLIESLQVEGLESFDQQKEGMDAILLNWDKKMKLEFTAAYNPLYLIRNGDFIDFHVDKQPVGFLTGNMKPFTKQQVELKKGDVLYLSTDGYQDQFGGKQGKKFKISRFKKLLLEIHDLPMQEQQDELLNRFNSWKGDNEQVDDVLVAGIRI